MPLDLGRLNVRPLVERDSLTCVEDILLSPDAPPAACPELVLDQVRQCAAQVLEARKNGAGVILIYGAHLLHNGTARILGRMMERGWITHLATNGAGTIHDCGNTPGWAARPRAFVPTSPPERSARGTRPAATSTSPSWPAACATRATEGRSIGSSPKTGRRFHPPGSWRKRFVSIPPIGSRRREPMRCSPSYSTALPPDGPRSRTTGSTRRSWPRPFGTRCR